MSEKPKVTSIEEIRNKACQIVELPGWEPGETLNVKLRRASLLALIQQDAIPNQLLPIVHGLIDGDDTFNPATSSRPEEFKQFVEMLNAVCKAVMVEPTYDEVAEYLTDPQRTAIFIYAQRGLKALELFRQQQESLVEISSDSEGVQPAAE